MSVNSTGAGSAPTKLLIASTARSAGARGGGLRGREVVLHARRREAEARRVERMGVPPLSGRIAAGRSAVPDGDPMGLSKSAQDS